MILQTQKLSIGIVGAGTMGCGIVQVLSRAACVENILWYGRTLSSVSNSRNEVEDILHAQVRKNRMQKDDCEKAISKISLVSSISDLRSCNCIIEAVSENIAVKREVFSSISNISNKEMLVASNTSSLSITELANLTLYPENVIGLHFFNPAPIMKLTEVIAGLATSQETIDWALNFSRELGKDAVLVKEAPGFIVNRMLIPMINEAIGILAEGVASSDEIDKAMRLGANHPIGPLALADLIGNDVCLSIMETLHTETGDPKYRAHPLLRKMVRGNHLGRKVNHGFFKY